MGQFSQTVIFRDANVRARLVAMFADVSSRPSYAAVKGDYERPVRSVGGVKRKVKSATVASKTKRAKN